MEERAKYAQGEFTETSFLPALLEMIRLSEDGGATLVQILERALCDDDVVVAMDNWIGHNPVGKLIDTDKYRGMITQAIVQYAAKERGFSEHNLYVLQGFDLLYCIDSLGRERAGEITVHEIGDWVVVEAEKEGELCFYSPHIHGPGGSYPSLELALLAQISRRHYVTLKLIYNNEEKSKG